MRILVTGGAGFIGSHVVEILLAAGHDVSIVDNLWERGGGRLQNVAPRARFYQVDVRSPVLAHVLDEVRPEVICHLAAQHSVGISTADPIHDAQVNVLGLINLLQCATNFGVRKVVFSSSAATYGTVEIDKMPIDEATPQHPESPYAITKLSGEHYLRFWKDVHGLDFTALRYGNVYGPRQDPAGEAGVIAIFARAVLLGQPVRIDWDGEQQRDFVYVGDVARANLLALDKGSGEAFCIGTGRGASVNALYRCLADIVGHEVEIVRAPKRPGDIYLSYFDCRKVEQQLGWKAATSLEDGLRMTVDYFRARA